MCNPKILVLRFANKHLKHEAAKTEPGSSYNPEDGAGHPVDWKFEFESECEAIEWFEHLTEIKKHTKGTVSWAP